MNKTTNYELKKPEGTDFYDIDDFNDNMDTIDTELAKKAEATDVQVVLTVAGWSSKTQTVSVSGVTASNDITVSAQTATRDEYIAAGIWCSAQGSGTLTFTCEETPDQEITVNVRILT